MATDGAATRTRHSYREELIGGGLWWDACAELARDEPQQLRDWVSRGDHDPAWAIDVIGGADSGDYSLINTST